MRKLKTLFAGAAVAATLSFSAQAADFTEGFTVPKAAFAANESGPYAGLFDELLLTLTSDFLFARNMSVINRASRAPAITLFAPTNGAFDALKTTLACNGIALADIPDILRTTLRYHVIHGANLASDVVGSMELNTLAGATILEDNGVLTDVAGQTINILVTDLLADNGVIHVIDTVMLPADLGLVACGS